MSQASWNLCPEQIQYNSDCYYSDDNAFDAVAGTVHAALTDIPDGTWSLRIKRDMMGKVRGAVRKSAGVTQAAVLAMVRLHGRGVCRRQRHVIVRRWHSRQLQIIAWDWVGWPPSV